MGIFGQQAPKSGRRSGLTTRAHQDMVLRSRLGVLAVALAPLLLVAQACSRGAPARRAADAGRVEESAEPGPAGRLALPPVPPCGLSAPQGGGSGPGRSLRVHLAAEPPHLNPLAESLEVVDRVTRALMYETLVECVGGAPRAALAESWNWSAEGTRLELRLRPGVTWHDGRGLTAIDVQASIEASLRSSSRVAAMRASLSDVTAVDVLRDRQVRLRLARPAPIVLRALCDLPVVPARLVRGSAAERTRLGRHPIGTGPFRFATWEHGERIRLEANPRPWRGRPLVTHILFEIDPDPASALRRVRRGELHVLPRLAEAHYPDQVTSAALGAGLRALRTDEARFSFVALNHRRPVLQDLRVRQALDRLWNRPRLAADLHRDLAVPVSTIGEPAGPMAAQPVAFSPPEAGRLLEQAGLIDGDGDRFRDQGGKLLGLVLLHEQGSGVAAQAAQRFALDAGRAGLRIQIQAANAARMRERLRAGDFDLALLSWRGRPDEDLRPLFGQGGAFNHGGFHSPAVQALLDEAASVPELQDRAVPAARLAAALAVELPVLFLFRHQRVVVAAHTVQGLCQDGLDLDLRQVRVAP